MCDLAGNLASQFSFVIVTEPENSRQFHTLSRHKNKCLFFPFSVSLSTENPAEQIFSRIILFTGNVLHGECVALCYRHLYIPVVEMGYSKTTASVTVFFISAFFHEYLVSVPLKTFKIWAFMGMMGQVRVLHVFISHRNCCLRRY